MQIDGYKIQTRPNWRVLENTDQTKLTSTIQCQIDEYYKMQTIKDNLVVL